ncbi:hypothetical protein PILCRDRAFT_17223 [Piloderma croceum F 1598]|uniref:Uncharacterized protein n=1 Tax=Piloderma croceum (strain F 1598) TaxID=765440 RepID=A0A0C3ABU9_PILCF|nr:hypothetical protein PILCRDRAFT_17223 [Piloderma croceum F 1598]
MYPAAQSIVLVKRTSRRTRRERRPVVEDLTIVCAPWFQIALPFMGNLLDVPFQIQDVVFWWEGNVVSYGHITAFSRMGDLGLRGMGIMRVNRGRLFFFLLRR